MIPTNSLVHNRFFIKASTLLAIISLCFIACSDSGADASLQATIDAGIVKALAEQQSQIDAAAPTPIAEPTATPTPTPTATPTPTPTATPTPTPTATPTPMPTATPTPTPIPVFTVSTVEASLVNEDDLPDCLDLLTYGEISESAEYIMIESKWELGCDSGGVIFYSTIYIYPDTLQSMFLEPHSGYRILTSSNTLMTSVKDDEEAPIYIYERTYSNIYIRTLIGIVSYGNSSFIDIAAAINNAQTKKLGIPSVERPGKEIATNAWTPPRGCPSMGNLIPPFPVAYSGLFVINENFPETSKTLAAHMTHPTYGECWTAINVADDGFYNMNLGLPSDDRKWLPIDIYVDGLLATTLDDDDYPDFKSGFPRRYMHLAVRD